MKINLKLSCKEATRLMEEKLRRDLSLGERIKLVLHNNLCDVCRHYERQTKLLEKLLQPNSPIPTQAEAYDSKELEKKIIQKLDSNPS